MIFPTGSDLTFDVGISIPISALSATSKEKLPFQNTASESQSWTPMVLCFKMLLKIVTKRQKYSVFDESAGKKLSEN